MYSIYILDAYGNSIPIVKTSSLSKAQKTVEQLIDAGNEESAIYAERDGKHFGRAREHLLLPSQSNAKSRNPVNKDTMKKLGKSALRAGGHAVSAGSKAASEILSAISDVAEPKKNPSPKTRATKKALAWFQDPALVDAPREIDWNPPDSAVCVGEITAIEYRSNKFDGKNKVYRHDVVKKRMLLISPDGSTLIVHPPFKITKRGIEG